MFATNFISDPKITIHFKVSKYNKTKGWKKFSLMLKTFDKKKRKKTFPMTRRSSKSHMMAKRECKIKGGSVCIKLRFQRKYKSPFIRLK